MFKRAWDWFGMYSNHLKGLAALFAILLPILVFVAKPLWNWASGPTLIVTVQRNESTIPPDLLDWGKGLAFELPPVADGLQDQLARLREKRPDRSVRPSDDFLLLGIDSSDERWATTLKKYAESPAREKIIGMSSEDFGSLILTLQNPSPAELKHIRINVGQVSRIWGASVVGTFLTQEEAESISQKAKARNYQLALPEIESLPAGGTITLTLYGAGNPYSTVTAAVDGASVTTVNVLSVQDDWFLRIYRSHFIQGMLYALLIAIALQALTWMIVRLSSKPSLHPPAVSGDESNPR